MLLEIAVSGMLLALEALPREGANPSRPIMPDAVSALTEALYAQRERIVMSSNSHSLVAVDWSPDGEKLATVSADGLLQLWSAEKIISEPLVTELLTTPLEPIRLRSVRWSPDSSKLAMWRVGRVRGSHLVVGFLRSGDLKILRPPGTITSLAWSPDGLHIAAGTFHGEDSVVLVVGAQLSTENILQRPIFPFLATEAGPAIAFANNSRSPKPSLKESLGTDQLQGVELRVRGLSRSFALSVSWSVDGKKIAAGFGDGSTWISRL